ncbi:MAG: hypothetical protein IJQ07_00705 [Clostridia bacterium]|nr:hypothetical protein [Clostridia bacterium]
MKEYLFPEKLKDSKMCQNASNLLIKKRLQIGLAEKELAEFFNGGYVVFDFGKEVNGSIRILTFYSKNIKVRIRFGESLTECYAELGGATNATNDHSNRDFTVNLQGYSDMTFGQTGFRFVRLDFFGDVKIKSVVAINNILNKKAVYIYNGKDKEINQIYFTAKRTIDLCAAGDYLWDGIKRDRLVWVGDIYPEMLALTTLYGRMKIIERSLDFIKEQTPLPEWMNGFPMYSMWWIIIVADYVKETDAKEYAKKHVEYIKGLVDLMLENVTEDGETLYPLNFVDWQTHDKPDEKAGVRALNIIAAKKAVEILNLFNENSDNAKELLYRLNKKEIVVQSSKAVLGLKFFATELIEEDKEKLIFNGAENMSTFMSYFILKAVASFDKAKAINMLKEYYGAMLKKGATTFWEDFDIKWVGNSCRIDEFPKDGEKDIHGDFGAYCYKGFRHSLCHGWSAGVMRFIKEFC